MNQQPPVQTGSTPRFVDNEDGTILDTRRRLIWMKQDSWQIKNRWLSWVEAGEFAREMNAARFAGFSDWRLPTPDEVKSLFDKTQVNQDSMGQKAYCSPLFEKGFGFLCWTSESRNKVQAVRVGLRKGGAMYDNIYRNSRGATRLVRSIKKRP